MSFEMTLILFIVLVLQQVSAVSYTAQSAVLCTLFSVDVLASFN